MKYFLVYVLDAKGELTKIQGFTRNKDKAKNCALKQIVLFQKLRI